MKKFLRKNTIKTGVFPIFDIKSPMTGKKQKPPRYEKGYPYVVHRVFSAMYLPLAVYCRGEKSTSKSGVYLDCRRTSPRLEAKLIQELKKACKEKQTNMCAVMHPTRAIYVFDNGNCHIGDTPPSMNGHTIMGPHCEKY